MEIIKFSQTIEFTEVLPTIIHEYKLSDRSLKELVYVLKGTGFLGINNESIGLAEGDFLIIAPHEKYYYEGEMDLLLINIPKWTKEQHKFIV